MNEEQLFELALRARENAYAPYSGFSVGAALLCDDGTVYTGCNVENASHTVTCCAERVAILKAVSDGKRSFEAIAIAGGRGEQINICYPCGVCLQMLSEFCDGGFKIFLGNSEGVGKTDLGELLPCAFKLEDREQII